VADPTARGPARSHGGPGPHRHHRRGARPRGRARRRAAGQPSRGGRELSHQPRPQRPPEPAPDPRL